MRRPSIAHRNTLEEFRRSYHPGEDDAEANPLFQLLGESSTNRATSNTIRTTTTICFPSSMDCGMLNIMASAIARMPHSQWSQDERMGISSTFIPPPDAEACQRNRPMVHVLKFQAYVAVAINVALVCISTGSIDFFYPTCVSKIKAKYQGNLDNYLMSPDFECPGSPRLATAVFLEHFVVLIIVYIMHSIKDTPTGCASSSKPRRRE